MYSILYVPSRTVYVHIRTENTIPISTLLCGLTILINYNKDLMSHGGILH